MTRISLSIFKGWLNAIFDWAFKYKNCAQWSQLLFDCVNYLINISRYFKCFFFLLTITFQLRVLISWGLNFSFRRSRSHFLGVGILDSGAIYTHTNSLCNWQYLYVLYIYGSGEYFSTPKRTMWFLLELYKGVLGLLIYIKTGMGTISFSRSKIEILVLFCSWVVMLHIKLGKKSSHYEGNRKGDLCVERENSRNNCIFLLERH